MVKHLLAFVLLISFGKLHAQEAASCSDLKKQFHNRIQKKTRAGQADNVLMSKYDVHFYFLDLNIERDTTYLSGKVSIGSIVTAATLDTFAFELNSALTIDSIEFQNATIAFTRVAHMTYAVLPTAAVSGDNLSIRISYHGDASVVGGAAIGDGFAHDNSPSWGNEVTWSLSQPYSAMEWFPCKQFLQDKADSVWVFITTDASNKAGANGILEGIDTGLPNNKSRYRWKSNYVIDYYLISVAVAKYVDYTIYAHPSALSNDSVKIQNFIYDNPSCLPFFKPRIDSMVMVLEYFSDILGLYPFHEEKYGHCMAPINGGMEHQTMTTIGNLGSLRVNAHELFHQWFGDHVTCKTWSDIFINEGFASYGEYLSYDQFRSHTAAQLHMANVHDDVLQDPNAKVWFTDTNNVSRIFDGRLTYNKGSAVIHTLRFILGDSLFFRGLRDFQTNYAWSTASILDLKASLQTSTGVNLDDYFNQWLFGEGSPTYGIEYFSDGFNIVVKVDHTTTSSNTTLFKGPLELKLISTMGDTTVKVNITQNSNTFIIPSDKIISTVDVDPNNWLLNAVSSIMPNPLLQAVSTQDIAYEEALGVYPIPTQDKLNLSSSLGEEINWVLSSSTGRTLGKGHFIQAETIPCHTLTSGIYFITFHSKSGSCTKKIIKN